MHTTRLFYIHRNDRAVDGVSYATLEEASAVLEKSAWGGEVAAVDGLDQSRAARYAERVPRRTQLWKQKLRLRSWALDLGRGLGLWTTTDRGTDRHVRLSRDAGRLAISQTFAQSDRASARPCLAGR